MALLERVSARWIFLFLIKVDTPLVFPRSFSQSLVTVDNRDTRLFSKKRFLSHLLLFFLLGFVFSMALARHEAAAGRSGLFFFFFELVAGKIYSVLSCFFFLPLPYQFPVRPLSMSVSSLFQRRWCRLTLSFLSLSGLLARETQTRRSFEIEVGLFSLPTFERVILRRFLSSPQKRRRRKALFLSPSSFSMASPFEA